MSTFTVEYVYTDDDLGRDTHRAAHRAYLADQPGLLISGPFRDFPAGALLVFRADSEADVLAILDADPFQVEGFVAERTVREFAPVLGSQLDGFADE